jgi:hypothetical protein
MEKSLAQQIKESGIDTSKYTVDELSRKFQVEEAHIRSTLRRLGLTFRHVGKPRKWGYRGF